MVQPTDEPVIGRPESNVPGREENCTFHTFRTLRFECGENEFFFYCLKLNLFFK